LELGIDIGDIDIDRKIKSAREAGVAEAVHRTVREVDDDAH